MLVIGAGGLGSPLGYYLADAGVGRIGIVDDDMIEMSNLHRQILFTNGDVGQPKADIARQRLQALNPDIDVIAYRLRLTADNALDLVRQYDVIVDGTDNFATRYLVNDACVLAGKPNVYGSIAQFEGQVSVFWAEHGPCYRCLYPEPPPGLIPSCAEGGVLGVLPGVIGSLQAVETIKLILGVGQPLTGHLLLFDALAMEWKNCARARRRSAACAAGRRRFIRYRITRRFVVSRAKPIPSPCRKSPSKRSRQNSTAARPYRYLMCENRTSTRSRGCRERN